jgi:hypothetical protein
VDIAYMILNGLIETYRVVSLMQKIMIAYSALTLITLGLSIWNLIVGLRKR